MNDPLPPFGIRGLCSPDKPFSILQVSEQEYDTTVKSYSEATLTWLDEDDGETITVGTGSELRERLCDPVSKTAPLIQFHDNNTKSVEDRYVHLFDISKSQTSLNIWREHEAYWSKSQNTREEPRCSPKVTAENNFDASVTDNISSCPSMPASTTEGHSSVVMSSQTFVSDKSDIVLEIFDHLATIFQSTSDILTKIAQKTRETNTSPIEDVLSGMAGVLGQTEALGLSLLEKLEETKLKQSAVDGPAASRNPALPTTSTEKLDLQQASVVLDQEPKNLSFTEKGDVDMSLTNDRDISEEPESPRSSASSATAQERLEQDAKLLQSIPTEKVRQYVQGREDFTTYQHLRQEPLDWTHLSTRQLKRELTRRENLIVKPAGRLQCNPVSQDSLLDHGAEDADFTARYPPLTTLRRPTSLDDYNNQLLRLEQKNQERLKIARSQYSKVLDEETQGRYFALSCFPPNHVPGKETLKSKEASSRIKIEDEDDAAQIYDIKSNSHPENTEVKTLQNPWTSVLDHSTIDEAQKKIIEHGYKPLPGAWPDVVPERAPLLSSSTGESSGAFFNRMMDEFGLRSTANDDSLANSLTNSADLQRHQSLADRTIKQEPLSDLRRSKTVNIINPAARLNRPFDATFPVPPVVEVKSELRPEVTIQSKQSTPGPVRSLHRSSSDRRPRSLYEPYRPFSSHRSFSPVWEDHLKQPNVSPLGEPRDPFSHPADLVTIYASGFGLGSTERDVTSIIHEHCKDKWGRNCLQECQILSTEPTVTAKLILKDNLVADQLIAIFDKLTLEGRILRFQRDRLKVEPAAREYHRYKKQQDVFKGPSRMRSLPTFASSARPRPHIYVAPRPQTIPNEVTPTLTPSTIRPMASTRPRLGNDVDACEARLRNMGFGASDPAMQSRLHVYAAAACGSVEEAIEMIEEDQDAHKATAHKATAHKKEKADIMKILNGHFGDSGHGPWS